MYRFTTIIACAATLLVASLSPLTAGAQEREGRSQQPEVPRGYEPPRGMCRIWITGVPPAQQPAPTDCATAIRRRPSNGRVVFGPSVREEPKRGQQVEVKELVPPRKQETPARGREKSPRAPEKSSPSPERRRGPPDSA